jgi:hypothetical protein
VQCPDRASRTAGGRAECGTQKKKPRLSARHIRQRYQFALRHQHWTDGDWERVVWSNETKVNRLGSDGREWVWKGRGGALTEQHVKGTVKFGGGSLMLWGCMTAKGAGHVCCINDSMDAQLYTHILSGVFLEILACHGLEVGDIIFQQDNDLKHTSRIACKWFEDNRRQRGLCAGVAWAVARPESD